MLKCGTDSLLKSPTVSFPPFLSILLMKTVIIVCMYIRLNAFVQDVHGLMLVNGLITMFR